MCLSSQITSVQMTLTPQTSSKDTGVQDCVTLTVADLSNNPVAGVPVSFTVSGVNPTTGSAITDGMGSAQFCYTGNNPGSDLIRAVAAGATSYATKNWGTAANHPPAVSAGPNQTVTLPTNAVTLNGAATDDGIPLGSSLTVAWTQVSGPAGVAFATSTSVVTNATFPGVGTYTLQLAASDSALTSTSITTVTVRAANANRAPYVDVGSQDAYKFEDNLLVNGDNEANLVGGLIPNWTAVSGTWTQGTSATGVPPFNGTKFFFANSSSVAELRQDVDVTAWAATINARTQQFDFSAWVRSKNESPTDIARIIIEYRDATNTNVLASLDSGAMIATDDWTLASDRRTAPAGTGFIRVRLIATRADSSGTNDAYFDQVVLRALGGIGVKLRGIISDDGLPAGSTVTSNWTRNTVIGNVIFEDAANPITTAVFDTPPNSSTVGNANTLKLSASDSELTGFALKNISILNSNQAPSVNAGENQSITLPASTNLTGTLSDDGFSGVSVATTWSKVSGPGTVTFSAAGQLNTSASFSTAGVYVLRLKASESQAPSGTNPLYSSASDVTITVNAATPVNQAPTVNAGMNQTTTMPYNTITLNGAASDDGLPTGSHMIVSWSQVSGPAQVTFSVPNAVTTQVTLPEVGSYVLKLTASDGELSSSSTVTVTVNPQPPANQAPVVNPGPNQTITQPTNSVTLNGSVQDDGRPEGATLTISWSLVSGPGTVTFSSPNQAVTQATFSATGQYLLQITASDTEFTVSNQVVVTVNAQPPPPPGSISVNIDSPEDGAVITSRTPIVATIGSGAASWTLEYSPDGDEDILTHIWTAFASGTGSVTGARV
jgi:hypothetical protein